MIKDVVVNLSVGANRDPACDYAISVARSFNAHLTGIAFAYDPLVLAASGWASMPSEWIEGQRAQSMDAAKTAVAKFEEGCRVGLSAESRVVTATAAEAANLFGRIARCFDLSIVRQNAFAIDQVKPVAGARLIILNIQNFATLGAGIMSAAWIE
jgi:hypothetical protein